jgi:chromosome segregation ATPase
MQAAEKEQRRLAVQCEELQRSVDKYRESDAQLQDQIISLTDQRKSLHSEVSNLTGEVGSVHCSSVAASGFSEHCHAKACFHLKRKGHTNDRLITSPPSSAARPQVESLQATLGIVRHEANSASRALEATQAQHEELQRSLSAVQVQCAELRQGKDAAEAQVAVLRATAQELQASLDSTSAQVSNPCLPCPSWAKHYVHYRLLSIHSY